MNYCRYHFSSRWIGIVMTTLLHSAHKYFFQNQWNSIGDIESIRKHLPALNSLTVLGLIKGRSSNKDKMPHICQRYALFCTCHSYQYRSSQWLLSIKWLKVIKTSRFVENVSFLVRILVMRSASFNIYFKRTKQFQYMVVHIHLLSFMFMGLSIAKYTRYQ